MEKKTKNIIVSIIIVVLIICLAFTIASNRQKQTVIGNFAIPKVTNKGNNRNPNNRFNGQEKDTKKEETREDSKSESTTDNNETSDKKSTSDTLVEPKTDCKCYDYQGQNDVMDDAFMGGMMFNQHQEANDDALKIALITIESFLLGGAVMFLVLTNVTKENDTVKNNSRRVK